MSELLADAADALERRVFFERFAERYEELRSDARAWVDIEAERSVESRTLGDRST